MQVAIVSLRKGGLQIKATSWDRNLGGRDFDEVLFDYFCTEFKDKYKIDVRTNAKASFKLRMACERVRTAGSVLLAPHSPGAPVFPVHHLQIFFPQLL